MSSKLRLALMYTDNMFPSPINPNVTFGWGNLADISDEEAALVLEILKDGRFEVFNFTWQDIGPDLTLTQLHNLETGERLTNVKIDETLDVIFVRGVGSSDKAHDARKKICERLGALRKLHVTKIINPIETVLADLESKRYLVKLSAMGIPMPKTYLAKSLADVHELGATLPGYVVKPVQGFGGYGVQRFPGGSEEEVLKFLNLDGEVLVQEFVPEIALGERSVMMMFDEAAYAIVKHPQAGNFKTNFSQAASIERTVPTDAEVALCRQVLKALDLPSIVSRIDLIGSHEKPMLMEATMSCMGLYQRDVHCEEEFAGYIMNTIIKASGKFDVLS